jgi:hypothetical protein
MKTPQGSEKSRDPNNVGGEDTRTSRASSYHTRQQQVHQQEEKR